MREGEGRAWTARQKKHFQKLQTCHVITSRFVVCFSREFELFVLSPFFVFTFCFYYFYPGMYCCACERFSQGNQEARNVDSTRLQTAVPKTIFTSTTITYFNTVLCVSLFLGARLFFFLFFFFFTFSLE